MADHPRSPGVAVRPLSPHLTIWRWHVTMMGSITHRATGLALSAGAMILAWWLVCISNGPEGYESFMRAADTPLGRVVLFVLTWSLAFHLLNGIRHLAWDLGYGFDKHVADRTAVLVYALSLIIAVVLFVLSWAGIGGYLA